MSIQKVISTSLSEAEMKAILNKIAVIRSDLNVLITLETSQNKALFKAGNVYSPFINKANAAAQAYPEILPKIFSVEEFGKDCDLIEVLTPIQNQINELAKGVHDTLMTAHSDALVKAIEVYDAVKQQKDTEPGLASTYEELSVSFQPLTGKAHQVGVIRESNFSLSNCPAC